MKHKRALSWLSAMVLLAACAGEPTTPTVPATSSQYSWGSDGDGDRDRYFDIEEVGRDPDLRYVATFKTKPAPPNPLNDHKTIGPEGGSLRVGDFEIVVPPGAVDRPISFRIRVPTDPREAMRAFAEFGPHMYFKKPVTIRLPASSTTVEGQPCVLWWTGFFWLPLDTNSTNDGRIEARTWHFSTYGTSIWSKGITLLGG